MRKLLAASLLYSSAALAQLVPGASSVGRPDLTSVSVGYVVRPTKGYAAANVPALQNRVYTDGEPWNASDTFPSGFDDGYSVQLVTDKDDLTEDSASYLTFTASRAVDVYVCRDDANSGSYAGGWTDTGLDVLRTSATHSCLTKRFSRGGVTVPGNDGTEGTQQFIVFVRDALKAVGTNASESAGEIAFSAVSYSMNEEATLTFYVERTGGTAGAASVDITCKSSPTCKGTLNTTSLSWSNGEAGQKSGTFTANDISGNGTSELELSLSAGGVTVSSVDLSIFITDLDVAPSAVTYYVNPSDGGCSDSGDGLARTAGGGLEPFCTIPRANSVAHPGIGTAGHVTVYIEDGNYRNQPIIPSNSGVSATQNIRYCAIGGDVYLLGPSSGSILYGINIAAARAYITVGGCDTNKVIIDGEVVFGTGGGQVEKGEDPSAFAKITRGVALEGDDITLEIDQRRTAGWNGIDVGANAARPVLRLNSNQHGTPYYPDGNDFGDTIWVQQGMLGSNPVLLDGGTTGRTQYLGGHSPGLFYGGRAIIRGIAFKGSWGAISTFSNTIPDGNRGGFVIGRNARESHAHDFVINGSGRPQDQLWTECYKTEGRWTAVSNFWIRNCLGYANNQAAAGWSWHGRGTRHANGVFENIGGPIGYLQDWDGENEGQSNLDDIKYRNIIVKRHSTQAACCGSSSWPELFVFQLTGSQTLASIGFSMDGFVIENASGSCADERIAVYGGGNQGVRSLAGWKSIYGNTVIGDNIVCTTDVNLDSLPSASTDVTVDQMATYLALAADDTLSRGQGVYLTTATNSGTNSTNLCVADVIWFSRPSGISTPGIGQWSGGYDVHIRGVGNRTNLSAGLTDDGGSDGCITLGTAATWTAGVEVGYGQSGASPNIGYVR
jgi:hypothetical protein